MLLVYTILEVEKQGWGSARTLGFGAVAIALIAGFLLRQSRIANPLMPLRLFRSPNVSGANVIQALLTVGLFRMFFLGALYMQRLLGYDALDVGLAFLPATLTMGAMSLRVAPRVSLRYGPKPTLVASMALILGGLLLFARTPLDASYVRDILPPMVLLGLGAGLGFPSLMTLAMSGATPSDAGLASGLVNTAAQVGGALGLAVLATIASDRTEAQLAGGESAAAALNSGYHLAYVIGAAAVAVALVVAVTVLRTRPAAEVVHLGHADELHEQRQAA
jgi:sugar phosphate permease